MSCKRSFRVAGFIAVLTSATLLFGALVPQADALKLKDVLGKTVKAVAVGFAVDRMAKPLNDFINTVLMNNGVAHREATKVVPIITAGRKGHIGACQVAGTPEVLAKVKAVVQIESDYQAKVRAKILIPSDSANPLKFSRVHGAGVSAIVDIPL